MLSLIHWARQNRQVLPKHMHRLQQALGGELQSRPLGSIGVRPSRNPILCCKPGNGECQDHSDVSRWWPARRMASTAARAQAAVSPSLLGLELTTSTRIY